MVLDWVVTLEDGPSARALPLDAHNLRCNPKKLVLGAYLLLLHLLHNIIVGNGSVARGFVSIFQDSLQDLLGVADAVDGVLPRDRHSVRGNAHAVVGIAEHTVDVKHHVSDIMLALGVVGHEELVRGANGEVLRRLGGGGRRCSGSGALPLSLLGAGRLPRRGRDLGRNGGVVVVVRSNVIVGSSIAGGGVVGYGIVVIVHRHVGLEDARRQKINNRKRRKLPSPASLRRAPLYSASRSNAAEKSLKFRRFFFML